jgi:catechol-2,3-dioxygenase
MPVLDSILETALHVDGLDRAQGFYQDILGLALLYGDRRLRAFAVGGRSVLLLFQRGASLETVRIPGGTIPPHDGRGPLHVAFAIGAEQLSEWEAHLRGCAIAIEGRTAWPRGGCSIYFRDPDGPCSSSQLPGCGRSIESTGRQRPP